MGPLEVAHRRTALGALAALAAGLALACAARPAPAPAPADAAEGASGASARHVILFVADGMGLPHEIAASRYLTGEDRGLVFHDPELFEWSGFAATWDVTTYDRRAAEAGWPPFAPEAFEPALGYDVARGGKVPWPLAPTPDDAYFLAPTGRPPPATDSAAAATALSTGRKTDVGNVAWRAGDPPDGALTTLPEEARARRGAAIGVVTTVPFTHATPAAFVAHATTRADYGGIGREIVHGVKPEVVIGGGWPGDGAGPGHAFLAAEDHAALEAGTAGYRLVQRARGVDGGVALLAAARDVAAEGGRLFGLFGGPSGSFAPPVPTGDGTGAVRRGAVEDPTLAQATRAALEVLSREPRGLFLLVEQGEVDWASHAGDVPRAIGCVLDLDAAVREAIAFVDRPGDKLTWENTLLVVTADHVTGYLRFGAGPPLPRGRLPAVDARGVPLEPAAYASVGLAGEPFRHHTNELVSVYARGGEARRRFEARAGSWYPAAPSVVDNTQIWEVMAEFLELRPDAASPSTERRARERPAPAREDERAARTPPG